ncbi:MAG TPA: hypothetical protein VMB21_16575, partial [Candidatus Limnocylindria bacterium]|nr:hypothetical protein [Candidatus Limnocylindria bacterium]
MPLSRDRIRLALDPASKNTPATDVLTGSTPALWRGNDVAIEFAIFTGGTLLTSLANLDSVTMVVTPNDDRQGAIVMTGMVAHASLTAITQDAWDAGTGQHGTITVNGDLTALDLAGQASRVFWVAFYALTTDAPARRITLGSSLLTVIDDGTGSTNSPVPAPPESYTKAEADARFAANVPLEDITTQLNDHESRITDLEVETVKAEQVGVAGGVATLDDAGHVPADQLAVAIPAAATDAPPVLTVGQVPAVGVATAFMRADAVPGLPGLATAEAAGFMDAADKDLLDSLRDGMGAIDVGFGNTVHDVLVVGGSVFVAGEFTTYGGAVATGVAKLSITGQLDAGWSIKWSHQTGDMS